LLGCFYISVIHLSFPNDFRDKLWVGLGLGLGVDYIFGQECLSRNNKICWPRNMFYLAKSLWPSRTTWTSSTGRNTMNYPSVGGVKLVLCFSTCDQSESHCWNVYGSPRVKTFVYEAWEKDMGGGMSPIEEGNYVNVTIMSLTDYSFLLSVVLLSPAAVRQTRSLGLKGWNLTAPLKHTHAQGLGPFQMVVCDHLLIRSSENYCQLLFRRPHTLTRTHSATLTHTCPLTSRLTFAIRCRNLGNALDYSPESTAQLRKIYSVTSCN